MEMKADIESGKTETAEQFHKIYIQRHENVRFVTLSTKLAWETMNNQEAEISLSLWSLFFFDTQENEF